MKAKLRVKTLPCLSCPASDSDLWTCVKIGLTLGWWMNADNTMVQIYAIQGWLKRTRNSYLNTGSFPKNIIWIWSVLKKSGVTKVHYNRGIPIFKYEKIEVCIYEIPRELVFIYGISGWNSPLGSVRVLQQGTNQTMVLTTVVLSIDRGYITVHSNLF